MTNAIDAALVAVTLISELRMAQDRQDAATIRALTEVINVFADSDLGDEAVWYVSSNGPNNFRDRIEVFHTLQLERKPCTDNNCRFCDKE